MYDKCLDCRMPNYGPADTETGVPCSICRKPLCERCTKEIDKIRELLEKDKEIVNSRGKNLINFTCSYCRFFGCAQVSKVLLDDTNATPGANLNAFRLLKNTMRA